MSNDQPTDLDLLALRAEGLADPSIGIHFDRTTAMEEALAISSAVPPRLAAALQTIHRAAPPPRDPTRPPPLLRDCERILAAAGWRVDVGKASLVYVFPRGVSFASRVAMHRSDREVPGWLRQANPGNWASVEWTELLEGALGPWVMATHGRRVVSLTHTPTPLTERSAEAGAWTDREFRGRGYGAAVTAQWADVLGPSGRVLLYSTDLGNRASQRLAARLGLRRVGLQWLVRDRDAMGGPPGVHPSSVLRRTPAGRTQARAASTTIPAIETARLRLESMSIAVLRAVLAGDHRQAGRALGCPVPAGFSLFNKRRSVAHRVGLIEADASQHPWMYRAIIRKADGVLLGAISFHHKAPDPDLRRHGESGAELGYTIESPYRRRGYAKESAIGMMAWASKRFGVGSFVLTVSPDNLPSVKTAASMGFVVIGEQHDPADGLELVMRAPIERVLACRGDPAPPGDVGS